MAILNDLVKIQFKKKMIPLRDIKKCKKPSDVFGPSSS